MATASNCLFDASCVEVFIDHDKREFLTTHRNPLSANFCLQDDDVHIWLASMAQPPTVVRWLSGFLSRDEQMRTEEFHSQHDRTRFSIRRGLLRTLLSSYLGTDPSQLEFCYSDHGKPSLSEQFSDLRLNFNLSHSHGLVTYAFALGREIGIDVERVRPLPEIEQIVKRFFSPQERRAIHSIPQDHKPIWFFRRWTRKEAYLKAKGCGLYGLLELPSLAPIIVPPSVCYDEDRVGWSLFDLTPNSEFVAALCVEGISCKCSCYDLLPPTQHQSQ